MRFWVMWTLMQLAMAWMAIVFALATIVGMFCAMVNPWDGIRAYNDMRRDAFEAINAYR
jgi:hypothetical protein